MASRPKRFCELVKTGIPPKTPMEAYRGSASELPKGLMTFKPKSKPNYGNAQTFRGTGQSD